MLNTQHAYRQAGAQVEQLLQLKSLQNFSVFTLNIDY